MRTLRIWWALMGAAVRAQLQYRGNFLSATIGGLLFQGVGVAFIGVVVQRFGHIGGWSLGEIALLYGMRLTSHALWTVPFSPLVVIDIFVRTGSFDRVLVRPVAPFIQVATDRFVLQTVGDLIGGLAVLCFAVTMVDLSWTPLSVIYLVLAVVGGALAEFSVQLLVGSLAFRMTSVRSIRTVLDNVFNLFGGYPLKIFPTAGRFALTFIVPAAFVAYFPATVLLERTDELSVQPWIAYGAPLVGAVLVVFAYRIWRHQTLRYQSVGH